MPFSFQKPYFDGNTCCPSPGGSSTSTPTTTYCGGLGWYSETSSQTSSQTSSHGWSRPTNMTPSNGGLGWQTLSSGSTSSGFSGSSLMRFTCTSNSQAVIATIGNCLGQLNPYAVSCSSLTQGWFISASSSGSSMTLLVYYDYSTSICIVEANITRGYRCETLWSVFNAVQSACGC